MHRAHLEIQLVGRRQVLEVGCWPLRAVLHLRGKLLVVGASVPALHSAGPGRKGSVAVSSDAWCAETLWWSAACEQLARPIPCAPGVPTMSSQASSPLQDTICQDFVRALASSWMSLSTRCFSSGVRRSTYGSASMRSCPLRQPAPWPAGALSSASGCAMTAVLCLTSRLWFNW